MALFHTELLCYLADGRQWQQSMLWSDESMQAAVDSILHNNRGLREQAARLYNIPVEALRRHVNGSVEVGARPGPATILMDEEEDMLVKYLVEIADVGYGLTRKTVMELAFAIVQKREKNPFRGGKAGRAWFEGFQRRHPQLFLQAPQPLSYCRAISSNQATVDDFLGELGSLYGRLNLITKPLLIYNCDETGISIVYT